MMKASRHAMNLLNGFISIDMSFPIYFEGSCVARFPAMLDEL